MDYSERRKEGDQQVFMFHEDQSMIPSHYRDGWRGKIAPSAGEIAAIIQKYVSSNCLWANGVRLKKNFRIAEWLGLDFDDGLTLEDAKRKFDPYLHVIGTTKSHQVEKGGKTCDRFRVFLRFGDRCTSADDYEETARKWVRETGADKACVDAARFFFPCKEIVVCKYYGKIIHAVDAEEVRRKKQEAIEVRNRKIAQYYAPNRSLRGQVQSWLRHGCAQGMRNKVCYMVAREAKKSGYSESETISMIMASPIPSSGVDPFPEREVITTVRSAFK